MASNGTETNGSATNHEEHLNAILLDYVEAVERGESPNRSALLATFPAFAPELAEFFATRDRLDRIATPLREAIGPAAFEKIGNATGPVAPPLFRGDAPSASSMGRVGDFQLLREVGRGGMGVVYEAEQISLRRRVAIKILPFAAAIDPRHLQRFRNEAQAAAQLHHSNIVPVYAVGADAGMHYYAMQFIDGHSLAQPLAELRGTRQVNDSASSDVRPLASSESKTPLTHPTNTTTPIAEISTEHATQRQRYFRRITDFIRQAAEALEYAHQVGVIHRDVKPANLMLDGASRLWVTDFGVALIRNDVGLTATGEMVGTVRYMSPEQALGKPGLVDHRTDVYSLGATLYELLTLSPVFKADDREAFLRQLAHEEPCGLRVLDKEIPAELETIVLKAIAKSPQDRYASSREFAEDLQRFLDDRPILARRPTLVDRASKWVRRHRAATLTAVSVLAVAALGLGITTAMLATEHSKTKAALQREREANERALSRAREAEDHYHRTRRAVDLFVELSDEGLLDFPPLAPLRQRLLEAAVAYYQELSDRRDDAGIRKDLEESLARLTRLQSELSAITEINTILLLDQAPVRDLLQLTPEQVNQASAILSDLKAHQFAPLPDSTPGKRRRIAESATASMGEIERILTAAQYKQLRQVFLQLPGPHAFEASVIAALELTENQKAQVRQIQAEATYASLRLFATTKSREDALTEAGDIWKLANEKIVSMLTPSQRKKWNEMIGSPPPAKIHFPLPPPDRTP